MSDTTTPPCLIQQTINDQKEFQLQKKYGKKMKRHVEQHDVHVYTIYSEATPPPTYIQYQQQVLNCCHQ
jgi:hypothetical protein